MKQTAVEWLQEQLNPDMKTMQGVIIQELLEQAKQMEKEQIMNAHGNKKRMTPTVGNYLETYTGEQYYKETYK